MDTSTPNNTRIGILGHIYTGPNGKCVARLVEYEADFPQYTLASSTELLHFEIKDDIDLSQSELLEVIRRLDRDVDLFKTLKRDKNKVSSYVYLDRDDNIYKKRFTRLVPVSPFAKLMNKLFNKPIQRVVEYREGYDLNTRKCTYELSDVMLMSSTRWQLRMNNFFGNKSEDKFMLNGDEFSEFVTDRKLYFMYNMQVTKDEQQPKEVYTKTITNKYEHGTNIDE